MLLIANNSIEATSGDGIHISNSGIYDLIGINGNQFGMYNNTNAAISISGQNWISITGNLMRGTGGAQNAIVLNTCDNVRLANNVVTGYASSLSPTGVTNLVNLDSSSSAGPPAGNNWYAAITGSPAQSLVLTGLDLFTDKSYYCTFALKDASGTAAVMSVFYNNDTTPANYERQNTIETGSSVFTGRANNSQIAQFAASAQMSGTITLLGDVDGKPRAMLTINNGPVSSLIRIDSVLSYNQVANLTSLTISSTSANGLAAGSSVSCRVN